MTDDWLKEMDNKMIVGSLFSDFNVAFDVIDATLLLTKFTCYGLTSPAFTMVGEQLIQ
jgi:hypothetical protein